MAEGPGDLWRVFGVSLSCSMVILTASGCIDFADDAHFCAQAPTAEGCAPAGSSDEDGGLHGDAGLSEDGGLTGDAGPPPSLSAVYLRVGSVQTHELRQSETSVALSAEGAALASVKRVRITATGGVQIADLPLGHGELDGGSELLTTGTSIEVPAGTTPGPIQVEFFDAAEATVPFSASPGITLTPITVDPLAGSDGPLARGTPGSPFQSLERATLVARRGDTLHLRAGRHFSPGFEIRGDGGQPLPSDLQVFGDGETATFLEGDGGTWLDGLGNELHVAGLPLAGTIRVSDLSITGFRYGLFAQPQASGSVDRVKVSSLIPLFLETGTDLEVTDSELFTRSTGYPAVELNGGRAEFDGTDLAALAHPAVVLRPNSAAVFRQTVEACRIEGSVCIQGETPSEVTLHPDTTCNGARFDDPVACNNPDFVSGSSSCEVR